MPFCSNCGKEVNEGVKFCPKCGKRLIKTQREQTATSALYKEVSGVEQRTHVNWFERHLNWTMVLAWVGTLFVIWIIAALMLLADPYVSEDTLSGTGFVIGLLAPIPAGYWVIRKKNRSMWWLLILWSYFFLLVSNKSLPQVEDI